MLSEYCTKLTISVLNYAVQSLQPIHVSINKVKEVNKAICVYIYIYIYT